MRYYVLVFTIVALVAGLLGFGGMASISADVAQALFFVFVGLLALTAAMSVWRQR